MDTMSGQMRKRTDRPVTPVAPGLPTLGRRGGGWVVLQFVLFGAAVAAGVAGTGWPSGARPWLALVAGLLAVAGLVLLIGGGRRLGKQLTPYPLPVASGTLRRTGVYRFVRHPMYGGVALLLLAWALISSPAALVVWAVSFVFLDAKRRREEAWLLEQHADYADYRQQVKSRLIPLVW
jgi:protein-S-isoprenylcysteine O-methyltransferase Ste14